MNIFVYDKTFEGFLTLVFESYANKINPDRITGYCNNQISCFDTKYEIHTDFQKAKRVWLGIKKKSDDICQFIYRSFLSESDEIELLLLEYIKLIFKNNSRIKNDYRQDCILNLTQIHQKVTREAHRMISFVRFQKTKDEIYYSPVSPDFNVLPLLGNHFRSRFADQKWIIYDTKRKYGIYYDLNSISRITIENKKNSLCSEKIPEQATGENEKIFQILWKNYYKSINISERKNLKVHLQFLPKRYWKYLPEKDFGKL